METVYICTDRISITSDSESLPPGLPNGAGMAHCEQDTPGNQDETDAMPARGQTSSGKIPATGKGNRTHAKRAGCCLPRSVSSCLVTGA